MRVIRFILKLLAWCVRIALMLILLRTSSFDLSDPYNVAATIIGSAAFDYLGWEASALAAKVESSLYGVHPFMDEDARSAAVRAYLADVGRAQDLESQISAVYADPNVRDPASASADLRAQRDALRADLVARQTLVEAILEGQVAAVLVDQGFGSGGQLLPPLSMRFTQVPNVLVVSPRDTIRFDISLNLYPLPVDQQEALEAKVDETLDMSSLIVPLGGIALYPAMVLESRDLAYTVETFAHEWLHHYLFAFPLGYNYDFGNETRIINETTANLFGKAIAPLVLARYYPETVSRADSAPILLRTHTGASLRGVFELPARQEAPFDFGAAMNETRVTVDDLLSQGKVDQAEAYMEQRRRLFVEHGYLIRKLNQAFFAFYGGYQSESRGEGGSDPIGPAVAAIRDHSVSIQDWIVTMRGITTREALLAACACEGDQ